MQRKQTRDDPKAFHYTNTTKKRTGTLHCFTFFCQSVAKHSPQSCWEHKENRKEPVQRHSQTVTPQTNALAPCAVLPFLSKCGKARSSKPLGTRLPLMACCPTHAIIWEMLMLEPACTDKAGYHVSTVSASIATNCHHIHIYFIYINGKNKTKTMKLSTKQSEFLVLERCHMNTTET